MPCCCLRSSTSLVALAVGAVAIAGAVFAIAAGPTDNQTDKAAPPAKTADKAPSAPGAPAGSPDRPIAAKPSADPGKVVGDPYPLDTCAVAGEKLDDKAVVLVHEGRELRFCCAKCVDAFKAEPAKFLPEVDRKIVAAQKAVYPMKMCVVMPDDEIVEGESVDVVWNNRLVRFCCKGCVKKFNADPGKFTAVIDAAVIAAQGPKYRLDTCPVGGEKLGSMGEPVQIVVNNRLVRLCCKACEPGVRKNPAAVFARIDAAK